MGSRNLSNLVTTRLLVVSDAIYKDIMKSKGGTLGEHTGNGILSTAWDPGFEVCFLSPDYCSKLNLNIRGDLVAQWFNR